MIFTSSSDKLNKFCGEITQNSNYVAIDTEFIRINTYFPELCLLQLAYKKNNDKNIIVLDVFKKEINYEPFIDILKNKKITKVLHAGRQDCEIFLNLFSFLPQNIFDTQVAAMVCGIGDQESYENLAMNFLSVKIDKTYQFMNWSKRPLSKSQINYDWGGALSGARKLLGREIGSPALISDARVGARVSFPFAGDEALAPARALGECRTPGFST